jgi:hypothetical protein
MARFGGNVWFSPVTYIPYLKLTWNFIQEIFSRVVGHADKRMYVYMHACLYVIYVCMIACKKIQDII